MDVSRLNSPQFWLIDELAPRLGTPNSCAIWNPVENSIPSIASSCHDSESDGSEGQCEEKSRTFKINSLTLHFPIIQRQIEVCFSPVKSMESTKLTEMVRSCSVNERNRVPRRTDKVTSLPDILITDPDLETRPLEVSIDSPHILEEYANSESASSSTTSNNLTLENLTSYIEEFSYSPRRFYRDRQLANAQTDNSVLGEFALDFIRTLDTLDSRLDDMKMEAKEMRLSVLKLSRKFKRIERRTCRRLVEARGLHTELSDARYLDELIFILNGEIDRMPLTNWPFAVAHVSQPCQDFDVNLVI